jgi:hypothetical protein
MNYLALTIPGGQTINAPSSIPSGGIDRVSTIFRNTFTIMLLICISLALIYLVLGGIQWITSGGDKTKLQAARSKFTWAIIGLVVAFSAFAIVTLLGFVFNVQLLEFGS